MKTMTVSKRFIALLCCVAVCIALIATALGFNLTSSAQAEDAQEDGIELLEVESSGDIQIIEEETPTPSEGIVDEEASQAGETAVAEETQTPAEEEPASGEPDETTVPDDSTEPENPAVPDDAAEPENPAEPEGAPEEFGEPEDAEPAGSEESAEPDISGTEATGETVDAAEPEPEDTDADAEDADAIDADAEETETEDADAKEEATSEEDDYGIMLLANTVASGKFGADGDNLEWVLDDEGVLTISGKGAMGDWGIGSSPWNSNRDSITSVIINEGVTTIGSFAFYNSANLVSIELPSTLNSIGNNAFYGCSSLLSISIPEGVTNIDYGAFNRCSSLVSIELPCKLTYIGDYTFYICSSLLSISIPEGVTSIGEEAFYDCTSLASVELPSTLESIGYRAFYECNALSDITIPEGVTSIGEAAFECCYSLPYVELPSTLTNIGDCAFMWCTSLTSISIPNGITSIGNDTFEECIRLASVELPSTLESIGYWAFCDCISLTDISIPESVTSIGDGAFGGCISLTGISIPDGVTSIGEDTFAYCFNLASVELPTTLTSIGDYAFQYCPLNGDSMTATTTVSAGAEVYSINSGDTTQTTQTTTYTGHTLTLPDSVSSVGQEAFAGTSVDYFVIGSNLTSITGNAFASKSLDAIIFDNSQDQVHVDSYDDIVANPGNDVSLIYGDTCFELSLTKEAEGSYDFDTFEFEITLTQQDGTPFSGELEASLSDGTEYVVDFIDGTSTVSVGAGETLTFWVPENMEWSIVEATPAEETVISVNGSEASSAEGILTEDTAVTFVNYYKMEITFTIVWDDADDADGIRPDSVLVLLQADDAPYGEPVELNADNGWSTAWSDLAIYVDGHEVEYIVDEDEFDGYEAYGDLTVNDGIHRLVITHTHTPETTDISVSKVWDDVDNQDGLQPASITVQLLANGVVIDEQILSADNGWSYTWEGLNANEHGDAISYNVSEDAVEGYTAEISGDAESGFVITNSHTPETMDVTVSKVWDDADNQDGIRPDSITVYLLVDDEIIDTQTLSAENGWSYTWVNLAIYADGNEIKYIVGEDEVDGYEPSGEWINNGDGTYSAIFTNTHTPEGATSAPTMTEDVGAGNAVNPGESITYTIGYTNGSEDGATITITDVLDEGLDFVSATDGGTYDEATRTITWIITDVPANAEGSVSFTVVVNESALSAGQISNSATVQINDEPAVTTNTVVNPVKVATTVTFEVVKVWDDNNDLYGERPELIVVVLLENGKATTLTQLLSAENSWTGSFSDLPEYDENGEKIVYSIAEVTVPNYTSVITGDQDSGFTVTNTYDFAEITNPDSGNPNTGTPNSGNPNTGNPQSGNPDDGVPQTGQDSLPIAPLAVSGAVIVAAGVALLVIRRRRAA